MALQGKNIIVGISGSIAAYKSPLLVRELIRRGAQVRVVMSPSAKNFVSPTVLTNLSKNPVAIDMFGEEIQSGGSWHIHLAHWCDAMIIAPCSATTLARLAGGIYDTALSIVASALPRTAPLLVSPAMDSDMWYHPAVLRNVQRVEQDGATIIPPEEGELASGIIGPGRMPEISVLADAVENALARVRSQTFFSDGSGTFIPVPGPQQIIAPLEPETEQKNISISKESESDNAGDSNTHQMSLEIKPIEKQTEKNVYPPLLKGKKVLITAGPTYEKIDDVRFIGNYSSGKMGFALAEKASEMGAEVVLITGPVALESSVQVRRIDIESAQQMYQAAMQEFPDTDIAILSAAVADFMPEKKKEGKIKKKDTGNRLTLRLIPTPDILASLGKEKRSGQFLAGFALESENEVEYGREKMLRKNCDLMIVNAANKPDSGFQGDNNLITILTHDGREQSYPVMSKQDCAVAILYTISTLMREL
jgi:phosphopantothenoylcysteine decarboxylase/phosphopantothenate--cysteine ligase